MGKDCPTLNGPAPQPAGGTGQIYRDEVMRTPIGDINHCQWIQVKYSDVGCLKWDRTVFRQEDSEVRRIGHTILPRKYCIEFALLRR